MPFERWIDSSLRVDRTALPGSLRSATKSSDQSGCRPFCSGPRLDAKGDDLFLSLTLVIDVLVVAVRLFVVDVVHARSFLSQAISPSMPSRLPETVPLIPSSAMSSVPLTFKRVTHQIRVHMQYIGHPVVGDPKYGRLKPYFCPFNPGAGAAFGAIVLYPSSDERGSFFEAPLLQDMQSILKELREQFAIEESNDEKDSHKAVIMDGQGVQRALTRTQDLPFTLGQRAGADQLWHFRMI